MRIAVLQMTSGIDPAVNARTLDQAVEKAAAGGAQRLLTPEMCGMLDRDRPRAAGKIVSETDSPVLTTVSEAAAREGLWVALGSLAIRREDDRWANRPFVIDASGAVV